MTTGLTDGLNTDLPTFDSPQDLAAALAAEGEWDHDNHYYDYERQSLADQLKMDEATWRTATKASKVRMVDAIRCAKASQAVRELPGPHEYLHFVTGKEFSGFDLVPVMLRLSGAPKFDSLTLTTLGYGVRNIDVLARMIRHRQLDPGKLRILASDFFRRAEKPIWQIASEQATKYGYGLRSQINHTKIILAKIGRRPYVVESSANLRSCSCLEQFVMTQNTELFDFHQAWIDKVWQVSDE